MNEVDKLLLLELARKAIDSGFSLEEPDFSKFEHLNQVKGVFVTILKHGQLRGAMGVNETDKPLYETVVKSARKAAFEDPRFNPLREHETGSYKLEVSIIDGLEELKGNPESFPETLELGKDGLILDGEGRAMLLPKVAKEKGYTSVQFFNSLAQAAGLSFNAWRDKNNKIFKFRAITLRD